MKVEQTTWKGLMPRVAPRLFPLNVAQTALNTRLQSGDIEAWRQYSEEHELASASPTKTLYLLKDKWLSWDYDVEVARTAVAGDTSYRIIVAGDTALSYLGWSGPLETDYGGATGGVEPFPLIGGYTFLGTPAPTVLPILIIYHPASAIDSGPVTSYVYTYVNIRGEESAPSPAAIFQFAFLPPASPIYAPTGQGDYNTLTIQALESGYGPFLIEKVRLYRAATGNAGTVFRFVMEVDYDGTSTDLTDDLGDYQLGEELRTTLWDMPPEELRGVLTLPNGVMAGFYRNVLCFSAQNYAHAWPVSYQLTTDTDIVGIGNIDTTVIVFTKSFPYLATGSDPAQYSMTKLEVEQSGTSRQSIKSVLNLGVVGATPDGLLAVLGNGQVRNLTAPYFTRRQWQTFTPTSIRAVVHDDIYFFAWTTGSSKGMYALDTKPDGFGLIALSAHFTAATTDPVTDRLYFVMDVLTEPANDLLPLPSTLPTLNNDMILRFDSEDGDGNVVYQYKGKLNITPRPLVFMCCQVRAEDYTNLVLEVRAENILIYSSRIASSAVFTLPMVDTYERFDWTLIGTSRVRSVRFGETMDDIIENDSGVG